MSDSTEWHKHKDGEWHRHHKAFYSTCDTTGFYDTTLGEPFREKSIGGPSEKAKPPKGPAVALSTTCRQLFMISGEC